MFRNITYGISNLFFFFKVIWNFRSWDHVYALRVYQKCLQRIARNMKKYSYHETKDETVDVINQAIKILDSMIVDDYISRAEEGLNAKIECLLFKKEKGNMIFAKNSNTSDQNKMNSKIFKLALQIEKLEWLELRDILFGTKKIKESDCRGWWY